MRRRLLVLAQGRSSCAAVDLDAERLLRVHWAEPAPGTLSIFDVVESVVEPDERSPFSGDTVVAWGAATNGRARGRRLERLLKKLQHPLAMPLFGQPTPSIAYWTLRPEQPSIALVAPASRPVIVRDASRVRCRFRWRRLEHDLPVDAPALERALDHPVATQLTGGTLARALGWRPDRVLVALAPPKDGMCEKVVTGLVPKP